MQIKDIMSANPIRIAPEESAEVAARVLEHYNIGALPVTQANGHLCGMLTDRDLALRCLAAGKAGGTRVAELMTRQVVTVTPETKPEDAAALMAQKQIRRLPVTRDGRLCGMVSLSDLAACTDTKPTLAMVRSPISARL